MFYDVCVYKVIIEYQKYQRVQCPILAVIFLVLISHDNLLFKTSRGIIVISLTAKYEGKYESNLPTISVLVWHILYNQQRLIMHI